MWQERALAPTTTEERARLDRSLGMTFHACPLARDAPPERQNEQLIGLIMHATQTKEPKACLATWKKYEPRLRSWTTRPGDLDAATRGAMASTIQELARCIDTTSCEEARASYLTAQHLHHEPDAPHLNQTLARELPRCVTTQDPPDMQLAGTLEQLKRAQRGTQRDCVAAWNTHHAELQALLHTAERDDYFSSTQSILRDHLRCLAPASCELAAQVKPLLVGSAKQLAAISAQLTSHCP